MAREQGQGAGARGDFTCLRGWPRAQRLSLGGVVKERSGGGDLMCKEKVAYGGLMRAVMGTHVRAGVRSWLGGDR